MTTTPQPPEASRSIASPAGVGAGPTTLGGAGAAPTGVLVAVGLVSAATLAVEVLQTRLFSVMLWHHLTYMVVTITLLGFGAAGSLLAIWPRLGRAHGDPRVAVSACCSLFAITLIAAFAILANTPLDTLEIEKDRSKYFSLFLRYAYLLVPFLFAGLAVAIPIKEYGASVHRTYFWNLFGSGLGSFLFLLLIRAIGGEGLLFLLAALGGLAGLLALAGRREHSTWPTALLGLIALAIWPASLLAPATAERLISIQPAASKAQTLFTGFYGAVADHYRKLDPLYPGVDPRLGKRLWTPTCRIDTLPIPSAPGEIVRDREQPAGVPRGQVHVFQDGDAPTMVWSASYAAERSYDAHFYGLGYRLVQQPRVLVIGPGGGSDVETALHYGAAAVTAVDINGDLLRMMQTEPFKTYTNDIYHRPNVRAVHAEGRSFLRREGSQYDLIQLSGTDTYAALSSGSYIFSESYLYTAEAFDDYFSHLSENGVLCIIRFRFEPPRETLKLVATAAAALQRLGVSDPRRHVMVVNQEDRQAKELAAALDRDVKDPRLRGLVDSFRAHFTDALRYSFTLVRRTAFSAAEVASIDQALAPMNAAAVSHALYYGAWARPADSRTEYGGLLEAMTRGPAATREFHATYPYFVEPATDDRPFFFHYYRLSDVAWFGGGSSKDGYVANTGSQPIGLYVLAALLVQAALAAVLLILVPLLRLGLGSRGGASRLRTVAFFAALGLAFLLVEITTIQRFVLYLGHPTYSLSVGLAGFLVFSGIGSALAGKLGGGRRVAIGAAIGVVAVLFAHGYLLPSMLDATLSFSEGARVATTLLWIAPLALAMGMPFPTGLQLLGRRSADLVPWALGINGAASVLASILSIIGGMEFGFTTVFAAAAALYGIAALTVPRAT